MGVGKGANIQPVVGRVRREGCVRPMVESLRANILLAPKEVKNADFVPVMEVWINVYSADAPI